MPVAPITPIRLNPLDKAALMELAQRLQRNQSETVRTLIRTTLEVIKEQDQAAARGNAAIPAGRMKRNHGIKKQYTEAAKLI